MEKVEEIDLIQWLNNNGKINEKQALKWLREIVLILDRVHSLSYFHRDLKPHNIMMRNRGKNQSTFLIYDSVNVMAIAIILKPVIANEAKRNEAIS
jgi:serine/threonine protein kinase